MTSVMLRLPMQRACATHFTKRCRKWFMSLEMDTSDFVIASCLNADTPKFSHCQNRETTEQTTNSTNSIPWVLPSHEICAMYDHPSCGQQLAAQTAKINFLRLTTTQFASTACLDSLALACTVDICTSQVPRAGWMAAFAASFSSSSFCRIKDFSSHTSGPKQKSYRNNLT